MQMNIESMPSQAVIHGLAEKLDFAFPELMELFDHRLAGPDDNDLVHVAEKIVDAAGFVEFKRLAVDLENTNRLHACRKTIGPLAQMVTQRDHAILLPSQEQLLDFAQILKPQRNGRKIERACMAKLFGCLGP